MSRKYTPFDHVRCSIFDQAAAFRCEVCGLQTENTTGFVHWLRWFAHDMTVGWNRDHWNSYEW